MSKRLSLLLLFITILHADYTITSVTEDAVVIEKTNWPIGTSGIVIHKINNQHETIVSRVEVTKNSTQTELKILPFSDLKQEALPTLDISPAKGDRVKLGWMHERVLLIAPTSDAYDLVMNSQENKTFISSDLFAVEISKEGHPSPLKEDLKQFCRDYDIGIIEFVIGTKIYQVDAYSLKVLESIEVNFPKAEAQLPFYSRVDKIRADMWGEGSDPIENYNNYYLTLLGEKK